MPTPIWPEHAFLNVPEYIRQIIQPGDPDLHYIIEAISHLKYAGLDVTKPEILCLAVEGGRNRGERVSDQIGSGTFDRHRHAQEAERQARLQAINDVAVVYYARLGNRVKIGYTTDLPTRMATIQPEELLATEPGGPDVESRRHRQFATLRVVGEWFRHEQPLIDHITALPKMRSVSHQPDRFPPGVEVLNRAW